MSETILTLDKVSKKFCRSLKRSLWYGVKDLVSEMLLRSNRHAELRSQEFWALRDLSFELHRGETLGIVGHNGAGKSTMLKLINGLIRPDKGSIRVCGRVGALIELGTGFSPVLTGRENIYVGAAVLGLGKKEVDRRLDDIIDFAEIGDFIDAPLQTYSSGMKVRLGFSVAANLNPEILLIDEVLSVGDSSFRQRCFDQLSDYKRNGGSLMFVSHNSVAVEAISDRVLLLDHGRVLDIGEPHEIVQKYEMMALELSQQAVHRRRQIQTLDSDDDIRLTAVECLDLMGNRKSTFQFGESIEVRLHYESNEELYSPYFMVSVRKGSGVESQAVAAAHMLWDGVRLANTPRKGTVACIIESPSLSPGLYSLNIGVQSLVSAAIGKKWYARPSEQGSFTMLPDGLRDRFPGATATSLLSDMPPLVVAHSWKLNGELVREIGCQKSLC